MDLELKRGFELALAADRDKYGSRPLTNERLREIHKDAFAYHWGSEHRAPAPQYVPMQDRSVYLWRCEGPGGTPTAKYCADSVEQQAQKTRSAPWYPMRGGKSEYDAADLPVWDPDSELTEFQRRMKEEEVSK